RKSNLVFECSKAEIMAETFRCRIGLGLKLLFEFFQTLREPLRNERLRCPCHNGKQGSCAAKRDEYRLKQLPRHDFAIALSSTLTSSPTLSRSTRTWLRVPHQ